MKLEDYREISSRCSQCNFCQASCPVFRIKGTENWVARNRLNLIREVLIEKKMEVTPRFREILDTCLLCTGCTQNCSSMVPVDEIIIAARKELADSENGLASMKKKLFSGVIKNSSAMNLLVKAGAMAQKLGITPDSMPGMTAKPFFSRRSGTLKPAETPRARVAYYAGCGTNFFYPETGEAVSDILLALNNEVVIPEGLTCCGVPLLAEGNIDGAAEIFRRNIEVLAATECDRIIMECTSCIMMFMKKGAKLFPADDPIIEKIQTVTSKIDNALDYISMTSGEEIKTDALNEKKFTYHVPCHLNKSAGNSENTAGLLASLTGSEYIPLDEPELCCGAGGVYYMKDRELSETIRNIKLMDIKKSGASTVVTECPMCRFYINKGLTDIEVIHPMELLSRAVK
ncbi:MAG TPA: (Fe-S)-binding protein [Spirochaetota bacterium]|nr:(Fe-S)-binding protein [Spirochaetota bacterium]HPJ35291.1 (Fe-S)-binding protein [Spirochaetota bacterium]